MRKRGRLVYVITAPMSAKHLLKGQLGYMREQGWEVHLICGPGDAAHEAAESEGVTLHEVPLNREISPRADLRALMHLIKLIRQLRPDVLNVSTPKAGLLGGLAGLISRVPRRVYVVRGLRYQGAHGRYRTLLRWMEKGSLTCATDVVAISPSLAGRLAIDKMSRSAVVIGDGSSNGVDGNRLRRLARISGVPPVIGDVRTRHPEKQVVLFVGRLTRDKGIGELAQAVAEASDRHHLVTVGPVEGELPRELAPLKQAGSWTAISYQDEVADWMAAADVLVLPSYREGFGNVVLEAAAVSTPSVVSDVDGLRDTVVPSETGIVVPPMDSQALGRALEFYRRYPMERSRMGQAAQHRASHLFRPERVWSGLVDVYEGKGRPVD